MSSIASPALPALGFIGAGRVARCLGAVWARAGSPVPAVASRSRASAERFASEVPGCEAYDQPQQVVDAAELIFITVPDDAIAPSAAALRFRPGQAAVHCRGASDVG